MNTICILTLVGTACSVSLERTNPFDPANAGELAELYGLSVVASDIPANLETEIGAERYFPLGDIEALAGKLRNVDALALDPAARDAQREAVADKYDWKKIGASTHGVYLEACRGRRALPQSADPQSRLG